MAVLVPLIGRNDSFWELLNVRAEINIERPGQTNGGLHSAGGSEAIWRISNGRLVRRYCQNGVNLQGHRGRAMRATTSVWLLMDFEGES